MEKHHSCLNTRAIIEYFREKLPHELPALLAGLGPEIDALPDPQEFLMEINNWVSSDVVIQMFHNARRITGDDEIAFEIGFQSAARKKLGYVQRIIMFAYKNPRNSLKRVQAINDKFNKNKTIELVQAGRDTAIIRLHWFKHVPGAPDFCLFNRGIYSGIPTIWNLLPARVVETKCYFKGEEYCEYHLYWQKRANLKESLLRLLVPWSLVKSTIEELEHDKELLVNKFNEIHKLNLRLKEQFDQLLCLQQTSTAALSLHNPEEILQVSLELFIRFTNFDRASIFLLDETGQMLAFKYAAGLAPELLEQIQDYRASLNHGTDLVARVALSGSPVVITEASASQSHHPDPLVQKLQPLSGMLAPLTVRHRIIGVLLVDHCRWAVPVSEAEKEFVMSFANQAAIALENALLYRRLETSERKYRGLVENAHEGIWIIGADGVIRFANRRMKEIIGDERLEGRTVAEFCDHDNYRLLSGVLTQNLEGKVVQKELAILARDRGLVAVTMSSVPLMEDGRWCGAFAMFNDISDRKEMEAQLLQQQKMEAVGTLAGGIAHNFNNILMNIMGLTGLAQANLDPGEPLYLDLKQIEQEVIKGSTLTKQLLSFGRGSKFSPQPLNLNLLVERVTRLFCRTRGEITVSKQLAPDLPAVEADQGQLEQVLLNLLVNAWQAMSGKGEMVLTTAAMRLDEDFCQPYDRAPGPYIRISLADSGPGMDGQTAARIFEPFFTTKDMGQGTGLGLATVYAIIKQHRGIIKVDSGLGRGTTFHLYLPASEKPAVVEKSSEYPQIQGQGTILLVDDEDNLRLVGKRILERLGYEVLLAENGPRALDLYQRERDRIDLIILDMIMPGMSGAETFQKLKEIDPDARVLLSSGYSVDGEAQRILNAGAQGFIQKPYRIEALSRQIAAMLRPKPGAETR